MLEAQQSQSKKLFGKKKSVTPELVAHPALVSEPTLIPELIDFFSQSLSTEITRQDLQITEVIKKTSDNITNFTGPRVLDWNKSTGRVALAESVIRNSESEFLVFRQRMTAMADADGCGGRNEMAKSSESGLSSSSNVIDFGQAKLNKALGRSEVGNGKGLCEHNISSDDCQECKGHKH